jgi:hypothetical protein
MNESQLLTAALASVPTMLTVLIGILINNSRLGDLNTRISELRVHIDARFNDVDKRFQDVDKRFQEMDRRFEEVKELWRSELHRVEEVLDARLKHLEAR